MSRIRHRAALCAGLLGATLLSGVVAANTSPKPACGVTGVWELVSVKRDGTPVPLAGWAQRKVVTKGHFMWLGQAARRDTLPLKTSTDSLRVFTMSGGAGTWTLVGRTYTEHLDYFVDPRMIGTDFKATCRTEGDRWIHTWIDTDSSGTAGPKRYTVDEEWRRIE
jgi:hypothetical protein